MLAINGGDPIRTRPFPTKMLGTALIGDEELKELQDVIKERSPFRHYGIGNPCKVTAFEEEAGEMLGAKYVLGVSSGTAALFCAAAALGIGEGDEVILPAFGWYSDYNCVACNGALPVFADIDDTLNIDPEDFRRKITDRTKAVIVIHYQGGPARMNEILSIAKTHGVKVIEDCAQAFGGQYKGKPLGTMGDIGIASFQANKMISCGEGGIVYTNNEAYFVRAVRYHDLGFVRTVFKQRLEDKTLASEENAFAGCQFRMSELQGAVILAQLRKLPHILERCRRGHRKIREYFKGNPHFIIRHFDDGDCGISLFLKFASPQQAESFSAALEKEGIPIGPSSGCENMVDAYPIKSRKMLTENSPPFGKGFLGETVRYSGEKDCPNTNLIFARHVAIGIGPLYSDEDIEDIIKAIEKIGKSLSGEA